MNVGKWKFGGERTIVALLSAHRSAFPIEPPPIVFSDADYIPNPTDLFRKGETIPGRLAGMQFKVRRSLETTTVSSGCWTSVRTMKVVRKGWYR